MSNYSSYMNETLRIEEEERSKRRDEEQNKEAVKKALSNIKIGSLRPLEEDVKTFLRSNTSVTESMLIHLTWEVLDQYQKNHPRF